MSGPVKFKKFYLEIEAVKITRSNFKLLELLDDADGVLGGTENIEDLIGDFFAIGSNGYLIISGSENFIPA